MANIATSGPKFTIASGDAFYLGDASDSLVGTYAVHLVSSSFSGSITVKARARGQAASDDSVSPVAVPYIKSYLNGAVGDDTFVTTAITDTSLILVPASGREIVLDCTYTSGAMDVYCVPILGAA